MKRTVDDALQLFVLTVLAVSLLFLIGPLIVAILMSFDSRSYLGPFPPPGLSLRWYADFFSNESFITGLKTSLLLATSATMISGTIGTLVALALTRYEFRGRGFLAALFLSPLMIPAVVIGLALLIAFSKMGIFYGYIRLLCGHVIVTMPFTVRAALASLNGIRPSIVEAAMSLGANPKQAFFDVTFPLAKTGIIAGCILAFAFSLDDVAVSLFLYDTKTYTLPIALLSHMRANFDLSVAAAATFLAFATVLLIVVLDRTIGLNRVPWPRHIQVARINIMRALELNDVSKRFGEVEALSNVSFSVSEGSITSLLGPSGCGKTTTLRLIAGFETPDTGEVLIFGQNVIRKRPYERDIGLVFQDYALFPHMTVGQNVAYGLQYRGFTRADAEKRALHMLNLVRLTKEASRRPSELSGGEQQRVALARAFAIDPKLVLLDEPLSALDAKLRQELRAELKEILSNIATTTIIVTHDQEEAFGIAQNVVVMNRGRIVQEGSPTEIYLKPRNRFVADFVGRSNLLQGTVYRSAAANARFAVDNGPDLTVSAQEKSGDKAWVCIRPERIIVRSGAESQEQKENALFGEITDCVALAADMHMLVTLKSGQRIAAVEKNLGQPIREIGTDVGLYFNAADCIVIPE